MKPSETHRGCQRKRDAPATPHHMPQSSKKGGDIPASSEASSRDGDYTPLIYGQKIIEALRTLGGSCG